MSWHHLPVLIPLVYFLGAILLPLGARLRGGWAWRFCVAAAGVGLMLSVGGLWAVVETEPWAYRLGGWAPPVGIELVMDRLSGFMAALISGVSLFVLVHSKEVVSRELPGKEVPFYAASLLLLGGLMGIVMTGDLFNLYVFLEISSLATYALVGIGNSRAPVSAFRYLIMGSIGASFYLLGLGFIFLETGSLNMADVSAILKEIVPSPAVWVGVILITTGLGLKMALFPLHGWLADTYTHASSSATALVAPIGTKVAAYALIRLFFYVFNPELTEGAVSLTWVVGMLGTLGIVWGSVMAIAQSDLKRMLAYSSVAQIGYIGLGIGLASPLGLIGAVLHILNHAVMKACLFLVTANLSTRLGHTDLGRLDDSFRRMMPWTAASFAVAALSMIGLPPTAGFFSKWYLLLGAFEQGAWWFIAVILLSSLLNAVYFFRVLERIYLRPAPSLEETRSESGPETAPVRGATAFGLGAPVLVLGGALLVLGLGNVIIVEHVLRNMIPQSLALHG